MNPQVISPPFSLSAFTDHRIQALLSRKVETIEQQLSQSVDSDIPLVSRIGSYLLESGGKRIRAILVILSAQAAGYEGPDDVFLASLVEWIHAATLLHDDVLDDADLRRGRPTVRKLWGNRLSVSMGDYAYFQTVSALMHYPWSTAVMTPLLQACEKMALGELLQLSETMSDRPNHEDSYLRIVEYKTGALLAAACQSAGTLAGATPAVCHSLFQYGLALGVGYQLKDDALDYADNLAVGKQAGQDFRHGVVTLPLLHLLSRCEEKECDELQEILRTNNGNASALKYLQRLLLNYGSIDYSLKQAEHYCDLAKQHLAALRHSSYKDAMLSFTDGILKRSV